VLGSKDEEFVGLVKWVSEEESAREVEEEKVNFLL
jgi:hypothetical protein